MLIPDHCFLAGSCG